MRSYKVLRTQSFQIGDFKILPIRQCDRYDIMKWRNDQIFHLRQNEPLTMEEQDNYFEKVISKIFKEEEPNQILFSLLRGDEFVGYGGLVHINWIDRHAEVSFLMNTDLENLFFRNFWSVFLRFIDIIAFNELKLKKIIIYAYDLRPHLYEVLELNGYFLDARLKDHYLFEGMFIDVVIYSKLSNL